ncbi:signal-transducing adaptor protein 1 isoform X2 [Coregonus clupeaformis]|uniref:signal-transducing adaptor protein 1 isoform X2 n=1 Tax=Coregonus clupeaformis TaxID=59861 RepID=UPI001E1C5698|nr:signal-transducing adaptor protein 1 isoform X2 [Coregonus clupeaformis]
MWKEYGLGINVENKASRRLWTCLCGNTLFFFNNTNDSDYVEKLELRDLISVTDDCSRDRNLEAARLILRMEDGEIKITAPSLEARELWKGFIYSVFELSVPSSLNLLPGQIHMMRETVETERERRKTLSPTPASASSSNLYLSLVGDMPACYQPVSRTEAEMTLERHSDCGNLLLRPGRDGASLAVTTRQDLNGSVFRHYRVTRKHDGGYTIDVETPISCATLHDVINCLVDRTNGTLTPFIMEGPYEESITFVQANEENGEKSLQCVPSTPIPRVPVPALPPKPGPTPESESDRGESLYLNDTQKEKEEDTTVQPTHPSQTPPTRFRLPVMMPRQTPHLPHQTSLSSEVPLSSGPERKALMPPLVPSVRTPHTFRSTSTDTPDTRLRSITVTSVTPDTVAQTISEELKLKLEKRRAQYQ